MVATAVGAEGLAFNPNGELLLCGDDAALAGAGVRLLIDDALCMKLGSFPRSRVQDLYDRLGISRNVKEIMQHFDQAKPPDPRRTEANWFLAGRRCPRLEFVGMRLASYVLT